MEKVVLGRGVEPYGTVVPEDSRLLRVLNDGFPVYEPTDLLVTADAPPDEEPTLKEPQAAQELQTKNAFLLDRERETRLITAPLDALRHAAAKFFVVAAQEATAATESALAAGVAARDKASRITRSLSSTLHLLGSEIRLIPSLQSPEPGPWALLAAMRKVDLTAGVWTTSGSILSGFNEALTQQKLFLRLVRQLCGIWPIQKISYAAHVFEKAAVYPGRAEFMVTVLALPPDSWCGLDPENARQGAPYNAWPPLPAVSPWAPVSARVMFSAGPEPTSLISRVQWLGDAAFALQKRRRLRTELLLTQIVVLEEADSGEELDLDEVRRIAEKVAAAAVEQTALTSESMLPEARALHEQLADGQRCAIDRTIHLVWQAQLARLKNLLQQAQHDENAAAELEEFEGFRASLPVATISPNEQKSVKIFRLCRRRVTVELWDTCSTAMAMRRLPVLGPDGRPRLLIDFELWLSLDDKSTCYVPACPTGLPANALRNRHVQLLLRRLPAVAALFTCVLRHLFLQTAQRSADGRPRRLLDVDSRTLFSSREPTGAFIAAAATDWIQGMISTRVLG